MKLLVVDDEVVTRQFIKYVLREENIDIEILEGSNGLEAIKKVKNFNLDIIFIDIRMPKMDGLEAIKKIKEISPNIKIVILSAYDEFEYAQRALRLGVDEYLLKPISPNKLIDFLSNNIINDKNKKTQLIKSTTLFEYEMKLIDEIKFKQDKKSIDTINLIFNELNKSNLTLDKIKKYMIELMGIIERTVISIGVDVKKVNEFKYNKQNDLLKLDKLELVKENMKGFIKQILSFIKTQRLSSKEIGVNKAKLYIKNNYHKKLYLKDVAKKVGFSSHYFSRLFKDIEGVNFSEYVNQLRIDMAKQYMLNFDLTLSEISFKVGYEDFSYFSNVFKKYENMLPSKYRQEIKKQK